ncbi:MAG: transcription antitermination factor NusB, partial [Acidobacteria bacterium]|nr:transcription antitermination factor NusB [Acidobacteriota bacterium]
VGKLSIADVAGSHGTIGGAEAIALDDESRDYALNLARGASDNQPALDGYITDAAQNWRVERLAVIDRLLLRLAIHELLERPGTPPRVVIDEAIELARSYSGDEAAKFVNGVLDGVFRRFKDEGKVID